ncbi:MAG: serine/threonine-protein kinase [Treponema sp.]|nr:serine/threonine-protein kinase [Treponema sp.]
MIDLPKGYEIRTRNFKKIVVENKLGEGGQGAVYRVEYDGKAKALKWYSGLKFKNPKEFYANLENNIKKGKPTRAFLWPEDLTEHRGTAFGYVMDLRPGEFRDFTQFLIGREGFAGITAITNAALQIVAGFRELHLKGYSYQDLNDGNFFINPKTGEVLICDNDNVSEYGKKSGIAGKPRYMAPEIVAKGAAPSIKTDAYSLAVVLFLLWVGNHPLEGKSGTPVCMDAKSERRIYGENPVFIWDPKDVSNRPVQGIHKGAIARWLELPGYLQDAFVKAFSKEALLTDPMQRIIERDWLRIFIRMRAEVFKCSCGNVYFADPAEPNPCPACRKRADFTFYLKTHRYNIPVHQRTKLYSCQTEKDSEDFQTLVGEISAADGGFRLKNTSGKNWMVMEGSDTVSVESGADFELKNGLQVDFGGNTNARIVGCSEAGASEQI